MSIDFKETVSGAVGAFCCSYSGSPFDVVKIRLQTQKTGGHQHYSGVFDCLRKICKEEGVLALWKGVTPALSSGLLENSVLFSVNGVLRRIYLTSIGEPSGSNKTGERDLSTTESALLGGAGGFCSATCITPLEVVKCRTQVDLSKSSSPLTKFLSLCRESGVRGIFRGWSATVCRDVPFTFFFFGGYEFWTCTLLKSQSSVVCFKSEAKNHIPSEEKLNAFGIYLAGGSAGAFAWGVAFPVDCVKSYMQTSTKADGNVSLRKAILHIYQVRGGVAGFYRGWSAAVLRAFPANAGLFLGYEFAFDILSKWS